MIRSGRIGMTLAMALGGAALLSMPLSPVAFGQSQGCKKAAQAEGNRNNNAQAQGTQPRLAQAENESSGGGMYGRQYSQAEGNRANLAQAENSSSGGGMYGRQYAQAEGKAQKNAPRPAAGSVNCP